MSQPFAVDSARLRALAAEWDDVVSAIATNAGPTAVQAVQPRLPGSHTAWVAGQVARHGAEQLAAAVERIAAMVDATQASASTYDGVDAVQSNVYSGMGN